MTTTVLPKKLSLVAAKAEGTPGTAETLTASEAVYNAYDIACNSAATVTARQGQGGFDMLPGVIGKHEGTMEFKTDVEWDGTATLPDWATVLMAGCGWVNSAGVLTPRSEAPGSNVKTLTLARYIAGVRKLLSGAVGNFSWSQPTGDLITISWSFRGIWQAVGDVAILAPTPPTDTVFRYASATTTWGAVALCPEALTFESGNEIDLLSCPNTASGLKYGLIGARHPSITGDPLADLVANRDDYGNFLAMTEAAMSVVLDGPSTSDITLSAPKAQIFTIDEGERQGAEQNDIEWMCNKNSTTHDQSLSITFNNTP